MFEKGKVSICVTTYNRAGLLRKLLNSILVQSYKNFEIIITDNSENIDTENMLRGYADERIRYYHNEHNIGMGQNALKNFNLVRGEFMTFTPDDDLWMDIHKLLRQVEFLSEHTEINIVYSNAESIGYSGEKLQDFDSIYDPIPQKDVISAEYLLPGRKNPYFFNILTMMLRCDPLLRIFKESYHFDSEEYLCYYIAALEKHIGFIRDRLVALREAEHYRVVMRQGKLVDWSAQADVRIKQILSIYTTLVHLHPGTVEKLCTPEVHCFLGRHIFSRALESKNILLALKTLCACYLLFEYFTLKKVLKIKWSRGKSFG
ncbi:MAG: glycosyltransferase family 2 protein [Candidatus Omnitrophica bacterium]|nr:glycosyltransferase family 2 protein [Candidatus Omnitrophota bacterium]